MSLWQSNRQLRLKHSLSSISRLNWDPFFHFWMSVHISQLFSTSQLKWPAGGQTCCTLCTHLLCSQVRNNIRLLDVRAAISRSVWLRIALGLQPVDSRLQFLHTLWQLKLRHLTRLQLTPQTSHLTSKHAFRRLTLSSRRPIVPSCCRLRWLTKKHLAIDPTGFLISQHHSTNGSTMTARVKFSP